MTRLARAMQMDEKLHESACRHGHHEKSDSSRLEWIVGYVGLTVSIVLILAVLFVVAFIAFGVWSLSRYGFEGVR